MSEYNVLYGNFPAQALMQISIDRVKIGFFIYLDILVQLNNLFKIFV